MPTRKTETRHHPDGKTCHHFYYQGLTCDEYDALRARARGRCEICQITEEDTPRGFLVVDHFHAGRHSFIRGLLCDGCNSGVMPCIDGQKAWGANRMWEAKAREYEANSWETPSPAARIAMARRTEMLPVRPRRATPNRARANVIPLPARRGVPAMAAALRRWLTAEELGELLALLTAEPSGE